MSREETLATNDRRRRHASPGRAPTAERHDQWPKRVLIAAPQPFFSARGTPIATRLVIQALSELGVSVDVLTYPLGSDVEIPRVRIFRCSNRFRYANVPIGFSARKLVLDVPFMMQLRQRLRSGEYDAVHANEEAAYFVAMLGRPDGYAFIYDMQSSIPDELSRFGKAVTSTARRLERKVLNRADMVVCSTGLGQVIEQRAPSIRYREWVFPAEPLSHVCAHDVAVLRHRLGIDPGDVVILYAGSFAGYQNADVLAGAASIVLARNDGVHFVFVGFTDAAEEVAFASALGPAARSPRVSLVRRVPPGDLHTYKALADILLSTRGLVRNVPIKLFELLATGKPIVANAVPAHTAVLDSTRAMLVRSAPDAYAAGISRLLEDRALARRLGCNAAAFAAERLGWTQFRSLIADVYASARPGARPERGKRRPAVR